MTGSDLSAFVIKDVHPSGVHATSFTAGISAPSVSEIDLQVFSASFLQTRQGRVEGPTRTSRPGCWPHVHVRHPLPRIPKARLEVTECLRMAFFSL